MALVDRSFMLNITPGAIPQVVNVSEYDQNRQYTVTLIDEGGVYAIPNGTTVKVEGTIGGNGFSESATISGDTITFTLTESMTAKAGDVWTKIKLVKDSKPIQTAAFILRCDKAGLEAETIAEADGFDDQILSAVTSYLGSNDAVQESVSEFLTESDAVSEAIDGLSQKAPYINSTTNTWMVWSATAGAYVDSEIPVTGDSSVHSYNGRTGDVVTTASDLPAIPSNDPRKVAELVSVAESYYTNRMDGTESRFEYNTQNTPHHSTFVVGNIACNVFAGLVLRGIPYADSPYGIAYTAGMEKGTAYNAHYLDTDGAGNRLYPNLEKYRVTSLTANPIYPWAINPLKWECGTGYKVDSESQDGDDDQSSSTSDDDPDDDSDDSSSSAYDHVGLATNASSLAQLLAETGWVVPILPDFSGIEPGDFLFWATKNGDSTWKQPDRFKHISHVAVVVGINASGNHVYLESAGGSVAAGADSTLHQDVLETSTLHPASALVMVCRPNLGRAFRAVRILTHPSSVTAIDGINITMSVTADGEGLSYKWQFKNAGSSAWSDASASTANTPNYTFDASGRNGRQVRCVVTDCFGRTVNSKAATLTVVQLVAKSDFDALVARVTALEGGTT